ncbi:GntR family transcriptional regulator [Tepidibacillus fermentans]|uniref:Phosphoenolpyruvate-dependent sugar phosphotransferase system EIIA component n=1 Tax=Tepidibacillus fermentans TaxID=1281767 RepID=A0A4R3KEN1_9BACI|nr:GntR family transcriptional regulator [Tepidibacillus fermentans]TCS81794.1 phosphoenolpyruvate-dependent sugar phosphotransferase system EIIA component [Tepidibacillus fermentans]
MHRRYLEIYEEIKNAILAGTYRPGEKLSSEHEFCQKYRVSRGTIRRALELLAEEGFVHSLHGKGVFVLDKHPITFSFGGLISFKEASEGNDQPFQTYVPKFEEIIIDQSLHKKTNLPIGEEAYHIYRVPIHGIAFEPTEGEVVAPIDGEIIQLFHTKHAVGIRSKGGLEILTSHRKKSPTSKREGATKPVKVGDEFRLGVA